MSGAGDIVDWASDFGEQTLYDAGLGGLTPAEEPKKRKERKAKEKGEREKKAARKRLKPIPDPEALKVQERKKAARRKAGRKGRAATILSDTEDTLG